MEAEKNSGDVENNPEKLIKKRVIAELTEEEKAIVRERSKPEVARRIIMERLGKNPQRRGPEPGK